MDLYRTLRIAIYLVAASGGWAISQAEGQPTCFIAVAAAAAIAWLTVDAGRMRPVRPVLSAAFGVALLVHFLAAPSLAARPMMAADAERMMHFLCALQIMLFFTVFRGSLIFTFCGANLFILVVSAKVDSDISLLLRMALFLGTTTWLLFIHALWLERQKFETRQALPGPPGLTRVSSLDRLPEQAFWQGLRLTTFVTLSCLLAGFLLFFVWPRSTIAALTHWVPTSSSSGQPGSKTLPDGDGPRVRPRAPSITGPGEELDLNRFGPIHEDSSLALTLILDRAAETVTAASGSIYLRDRAMADFREDGKWATPLKVELRLSPLSNAVEFDKTDPRFLEPPDSREIVQTLRPSRSLASRSCFVLAPVRAVERKPIEIDEEGSLLLPGRQWLNALTSLTIRSNRPVRSTELPPNAVARDPDKFQRYSQWRRAFRGGGEAQEIRALAARITRDAQTDLERIAALLQHLKSAPFSYTLELDRRRPTARNPLAEFLLSEETAQRQGHCGYFASAFVILARASGLPARLASGFARPLLPNEGARREIVIRNSDAHAWAEVYFERYGWVTFDPTVGVSPAPSIARASSAVAGTRNPQPDGTALKPIDSGWLDRGWTFFMRYTREDQERMYDRIGDRLERATDAAEGMFSLGIDSGGLGVMLTWLPVFGTGVALVLFFFWNRKDARRAKPAVMPRSSRAAVTFYQELLHVLSKHGFFRQPGQTPREFAASVVRRGGDAFLPALVVTHVFERVRYGGEEPTPMELDDLRASMEFLNRYDEPAKQ